MRTYKRSDCVKFCIARIQKLWKNHGYDAKYAERNKAYNECKEFCKNNGYSGVNFNDIWRRSLNMAKNTI